MTSETKCEICMKPHDPERACWTVFCRALSTAGLPECCEPEGHGGAHIFAFEEAERLLDRCAVMLRERASDGT